MTHVRAVWILVYVSIAILVAFGAYAAWYSFHRRAIIAQTTQCQYRAAHPEDAPKMRAPDGSLVPVMTACPLEPVPPPLFDLLRGRITIAGVPGLMQVRPYTLWDILLGRYSIGPSTTPCYQSATTTSCGSLVAPAVRLK